MSEFQASNFKKENGGTPDLLGKTELTSPYFFVPPSGTTAERPQSCAAGTLRFNTDIGTLEVYRGDVIGWEQIQRESTISDGDLSHRNSWYCFWWRSKRHKRYKFITITFNRKWSRFW